MLTHSLLTTPYPPASQLADWRQRPLPPELVEYARQDVRYLLHIADCLGEQLLAEPQPQRHARQQPLEQQQPDQQTEDNTATDTAAADMAAADTAAAAAAVLELQAGSARTPTQQQQEEEGEGEGEEEEEEELLKQPHELGEHHSPPPSVVDLSEADRGTLAAAMDPPSSRLARAVHRSQAVALALHQPTPPAAAVAAATMSLMRRYVAAALEEHARLTLQQVQHLECVADCVHVLASWRDEAARAADEGLQCLLPDATLMLLAEAAAGSVAPDACNLRGSAQGLTEQQLLGLLQLPKPGEQQNGGAVAAAGDPSVAAAPGVSCGHFPAMLQRQVARVAVLLSDAAAGQRPWVAPELTELLAEVERGGGFGGRPGLTSKQACKRRDPAAFRSRLAQRFAAKSTVRGGRRGRGGLLGWEGALPAMGVLPPEPTLERWSACHLPATHPIRLPLCL